MFNLRNFTILFTRWAHFKFDACYRSQHVGTGACLPCCSISSSFQKTCGHRGYEFLEFWCWNLVPFLPDIGFQLLKSLWLSLTYFPFNDGPNVHYRWKIWTAGRPIQHLVSSITKSYCCNSCSKRFCIVLLKYVSYGGEHMLLYKLHIPFSIHSAFQNMQAAHTVCTYAPPYHRRCWLEMNWTLMTRWKVSLLFISEDTASVISNRNVKFGLAWPLNTFPLWNSPF